MIVTMSCDWCVIVWQWCHIDPNPKSPKIKIKEKKITNEKRKNKIVRVYCLELWQQPVIVYLNSYILFQLYFIFISFLVNKEAYDYGYIIYHII